MTNEVNSVIYILAVVAAIFTAATSFIVYKIIRASMSIKDMKVYTDDFIESMKSVGSEIRAMSLDEKKGQKILFYTCLCIALLPIIFAVLPKEKAYAEEEETTYYCVCGERLLYYKYPYESDQEGYHHQSYKDYLQSIVSGTTISYPSSKCDNLKVYPSEAELATLEWVKNSYAETDKGIEEANKNKSWMQGLIEGMLDSILNTGTGDGFTSPTNLAKNTYGYILYAVKGTKTSGISLVGAGNFDGLANMTAYELIKSIAVLFMIAFFFYETSAEKINEIGSETTIEKAVKPYVKLVLTTLLIYNIENIMLAFLSLSQVVSNVVSQALSDTSSTDSTWIQNLKSTIVTSLGFVEGDGIFDFITNLGSFVAGVVALVCPYIISMVCEVGIFFVLFKRMLEIVVLTIFAPFAAIDFHKGSNSHALRFFKSYLGVCFQAAAIMLVLAISGIVCGIVIQQFFLSYTGDGVIGVSSAAFTMCAVKLGQLTTVAATGSLTSKVFGGS